MKRRSKLFTITLLTLATVGLLLPVHASALSGIPVSGTFTDSFGGTGNFVGTFNPQNFAVQNGALVLVGSLVGTLTDSKGTLLGTIVRANHALPVGTPAGSSCAILNLTLGPLHLTLLGLNVSLNQVHLVIT